MHGVSGGPDDHRRADKQQCWLQSACADGFSHKSRRDGRTDEHAAAYPRSHSLSDRTTHEHADAMPGGLLLPHLLRLHGVSEGLVQ